jgi:hypothetical protein
MSKNKHCPSLEELHSDKPALTEIESDWQMLYNSEPKPEWLKEHPDYPGRKYLPIDKTEIQLTRLFGYYKVTVLREGVERGLGVWVTLEIGWTDPETKEWRTQTGSAGWPCTKQADLKGAFQAAKSEAIKDAAHHIGKVFGRDLNRDSIVMELEKPPDKWQILRKEYEQVKDKIAPEEQINIERIMGCAEGSTPEETSYNKVKKSIQKLIENDKN